MVWMLFKIEKKNLKSHKYGILHIHIAYKYCKFYVCLTQESSSKMVEKTLLRIWKEDFWLLSHNIPEYTSNNTKNTVVSNSIFWPKIGWCFHSWLYLYIIAHCTWNSISFKTSWKLELVILFKVIQRGNNQNN